MVNNTMCRCRRCGKEKMVAFGKPGDWKYWIKTDNMSQGSHHMYEALLCDECSKDAYDFMEGKDVGENNDDSIPGWSC